MTNYAESKNTIDKIRSKYGCKGEIIFRTAIQMVVEHGRNSFKDEIWFEDQMNFIDERHDSAESVGKFLFMTRDFEKAIYEMNGQEFRGKDNVPFHKGGDININGVEVQVKYLHARICYDKTLTKLKKAS